MAELDDIDMQIMRVLQDNSRLTTKELAAKVHLSATPVYERMKRLEREGYIKKYIAVLDVDKLNQGFIVYCNAKLKKLNREIVNEFIETIKAIPEVTECYNTSGRFDYMLKIHAKDMKSYQDFVFNKLGAIECLSSWESTFVMSEVKNEHGIKI
jgi:Lrp/AsnC family transcriptional regulator, leucine-responsive regulatory protein